MINDVRNTVLSVLNKNNYGYISPSDFNLYAKNAQMEMYEEYFSSYNKTINAENARLSGTDYADIESPLAETLETFIHTDTLTQVTVATNQYYYPSLVTTGHNAYMVSKIEIYNSLMPNVRLGEAEKVSVSKINMLVDSIYTTPNTKYPAYTLIGDIVTVYPETINGVNSVQCTYFSYPADPKWTYITLVNGEPAFDQSQPDYQDFELPLEDSYKLVMKILQYCGVSIRESEVAAFAIGQEQHEQPTFSQQQ